MQCERLQGINWTSREMQLSTDAVVSLPVAFQGKPKEKLAVSSNLALTCKRQGRSNTPLPAQRTSSSAIPSKSLASFANAK